VIACARNDRTTQARQVAATGEVVDFGVAALISWLLTAAFGGVLVLLWTARSGSRPLRGGRRATYGRPPPYIPRWLVVAHVSLAVIGLAAWAAALALVDDFAYFALPALLLVALLGGSMFLRWLGSRRARRVVTLLDRAPSESRIPTLVVYSHGLLGLTTVVLVLLSYFRP